MSKLHSMYLNLKEQNPDSLFLFKSGIFLIALDEELQNYLTYLV